MDILKFSGFTSRTEVTPVPNLFITQVMTGIHDIIEMKVVLYVFWLLAYRKGYPRLVTFQELRTRANVLIDSQTDPKKLEELLKNVLKHAVEINVLIHLAFKANNQIQDVYFINNEEGRTTFRKLQNGNLVLDGLSTELEGENKSSSSIDIFSLYEQNIGLITPIIAQELQEAEQKYPKDWIESAFKEAVTMNKRSWKYIFRILQRWAAQGRDDGTFRKFTQKDIDSKKYVRGKYGHLVEQ